jgi:hypothetical protein
MALSPEVINALRAEAANLRSRIDSIDKNIDLLQADRADLLRHLDPIEKIAGEVKADIKADLKTVGGHSSQTAPSPMPVSSGEPAQATPPEPTTLKDKLLHPVKSSAWAK